MLRIHFTSEDLLRIRIALSADPLWEVLLSLHRIHSPEGGLVFGGWQRGVRARLQQDAVGRLAHRILAPLMPAANYVPDFLTPAESGAGLEPGIEAVLSTPRRRLTHELSRLATVTAAPPFARTLADGNPAALTRLGQALHAYHDVALAPYWEQIQTRIAADRATRVQALADHGVEDMLAGLERMRWRPPVLEVDYPVDQVLHLGGRGLVLVPSAFCWRMPVTLADPTLPPVLVYPAGQQPAWLDGTGPHATSGGLAALIGPTRAAILERLVGTPSTTGELARLVATTPATVSKHTSVLREAGLVISFQRGRNVYHMPTPLGSALVNTPEPGPATRTRPAWADPLRPVKPSSSGPGSRRRAGGI